MMPTARGFPMLHLLRMSTELLTVSLQYLLVKSAGNIISQMNMVHNISVLKNTNAQNLKLSSIRLKAAIL